MIVKSKEVKALIHFYFNLIVVSIVSEIVIKLVNNLQVTYYIICTILGAPVGFYLSRIMRKEIYCTKDYYTDAIVLSRDSIEFSNYCICAILVFTAVFSTIVSLLFVIVFIYSLSIKDLFDSVQVVVLSITAIVVKIEFCKEVCSYE